ncbi:flagellar motor protein MotB [Fictibacillus enclensis]|uniref:Flagellar motor protein MotB n=1 Tax=Fictibacillus enclensis TaxID=1017270 RepID=A0A0V8JBE0_9BACL|nr:flagellar motor protein MotB [Fictibacillus enclensis]KSU84152.1 flagellar motor protein MotB [Fictibacillus enclensis]MDM5336913.1 flagellar motor protein MotB [Fictibacillus enclensis]WHY73334.1 flagellar motor protein MotB [Fictibacillus enclensis]SCB73965.1 chemotaxis protein MotB [Fictibacillus enclensis]
MARRKRKKHDDHVDESWLVPYSDMLTLLLALFIVLFAMSEVDASKFKQMASAFNDEFTGGTGMMEEQAPISSPETDPLPDKEKLVQLSLQEKERMEKAKKELESLQEVKKHIDNFIEDKDLSKSLQTKLTENGLLITILDNALFDSGSAEVKPESVGIGKDLSKLLVTNPPRNIIIAGHTDNVPIKNAQYTSNWELSAMRAINFMQILRTNPNLSPKTLSASGYGEYRPRASNKTAEGRAKNRRVEVLVLPNYSLEKDK